MNTEIQKQEQAIIADKPGALAIMASRCSVEPKKLLDTLKATVFKGATTEELLALVVTANEYDLNPMLKEIYAFPQKGGIAPIVSIDGWLKIINRQPNFDGMSIEVSKDGAEATCTIYTKDRNHPVSVTEYASECARNTEPWKQFPRRMLRHKAIMQCGRVAFGISGIHDEDEAKDIARNAKMATVVSVRDTAIDPFATNDTSSEPNAATDAKDEAEGGAE